MIRKEIWLGRQLLLFLTCKRLFGKWNIWIWPPISTVKIRFQDSRKLWSASTFLDFIEDSILKSQYKNYIKLISSLGSSEDRCSQGHHETFKLLWEAIWGNSSYEPHHHSCCDKINNRKCLQQQQLEELQRTGNERFIWGPKGWADGPLFTRCDSMVKTVLDKYWQKMISFTDGWHFIMSENLLKTSKLILRSDQRRTTPMLGDCKFPRGWWFHTDNLWLTKLFIFWNLLLSKRD